MFAGKLVRSILLAAVFLIGGVAYHSWNISTLTPSDVAQKISTNLQRQLSELEREAESLLKAGFNNPLWTTTKHTFFLVDSVGVKAWSGNDYMPEVSLVLGTLETKLIQSQRGDFLIRKWTRSDQSFLICVVSLAERFKVTNQYLSPHWNASIFPIEGITILDKDSPQGTSICIGNTCYFKILLNPSLENISADWISIALISLGIILMLISLYYFLLSIHRKEKYELVFIVLFLTLYLIRMAMIYSGFPARWGRFALFDPQRFASSSFNVSLGDFVLNASVVFACTVYLFLNYSKFKWFQRAFNAPAFYQWLFGILCLTAALFSFLFPFLFFEIIFHNSSIPLDITKQVHFDWLRIFAFAAIVLGTLSSFLVCHVLVKLAIQLVAKNIFRFGVQLLLATILFLIYCLIEKHDYSISLLIGLIYFLIIYLSGWHRSLAKTSFATFLYFLLTILAYSWQGALSVRAFTKEATLASQFRFANNDLINQDILGEFLLSENVKRMAQNQFIQTRLASPFLSKEVIRQRVKQVYFGSYFDRYEVAVYLYNSMGDPLNNQSTEGLASSIQAFQRAAVKTEYEGVYWINEPIAGSVRRYIGIVPIHRSGALIGFIVLDLSLKRIIPQNVYPELLVDNRFSQFIGNKDFSYAILANGITTSSFGNYNYDRNFDKNLLNSSLLYREGVEEDGFQHISVEGDSGQRAIVTTAAYPFFFTLANFAFLFVIGLGIILVWMVVVSAISLWSGYKLNYSAQIQLYVYLSFILPLLIVTVATLSLTSKANQSQLEKDFQLKAQQMTDRITTVLDEAETDSISPVTNLETELTELSQSSNADINIFDENGLLMASSQPAIFENQLTSELMNRQAWQGIVEDKETYLIKKESIGSLQYNSSYLALKSPASGKLLGVLNLPFFKSADAFERSQAVVLSNILIIFVVVFILFSLVSFYAVEWLTFPLRFITKTLSKTTLTGENQPLQWKSDDEIGLMVSEYNRMLTNLEQSKVELSRSQKESAWREMAQQVAHEIKNPLTPMKLTLQQMELSQQGDKKKLNSIKMLLEQVNILNDIASSFSTFAKMPSPQLSKVNVVSILRNAVNLYSNHPAGRVILNAEHDHVYILGDDPLLNRIFSNLILNGLQSSEEGKEILVDITLSIQNNRCLIRFVDNGKGIDHEAKERVFMPYFSTKKSGSGLGLAIAKQGIEQCGGTIGFVSEVGKGTEFWLELAVSDR
jgi:two-component system, NtrC family, nitrogen regulation sensor histidine kinase NtrY